jgi:hypothetical protein
VLKDVQVVLDEKDLEEEAVPDVKVVQSVRNHDESLAVQKQLHKDLLTKEKVNSKKHKLNSKVPEEHLELLCVQQANERLPTRKLLLEQEEYR